MSDIDKLCQAIHRLIIEGLFACHGDSERVIDKLLYLVDAVELDGADATEIVAKQLALLMDGRGENAEKAAAWYAAEKNNREAQYRDDKRKYG